MRQRAILCSKGPVNGLLSPEGNFFTCRMSGFSDMGGTTSRRFTEGLGVKGVNTNRVSTLILSYRVKRVPSGDRVRGGADGRGRR